MKVKILYEISYADLENSINNFLKEIQADEDDIFDIKFYKCIAMIILK